MDDEARLRRMTARTFRWNDADDTTGYFAAEIDGEHVRWSRWSHVHGEGERPLGVQSARELREAGPPHAVPARVLAQILDALSR